MNTASRLRVRTTTRDKAINAAQDLPYTPKLLAVPESSHIAIVYRAGLTEFGYTIYAPTNSKAGMYVHGDKEPCTHTGFLFQEVAERSARLHLAQADMKVPCRYPSLHWINNKADQKAHAQYHTWQHGYWLASEKNKPDAIAREEADQWLANEEKAWLREFCDKIA